MYDFVQLILLKLKNCILSMQSKTKEIEKHNIYNYSMEYPPTNTDRIHHNWKPEIDSLHVVQIWRK